MASYDEAPFGEALAQRLICPVCNRLMDDPYFLPCLHRFCKGCLDGHQCATCHRTYEPREPCRSTKLGGIISKAQALMSAVEAAVAAGRSKERRIYK